MTPYARLIRIGCCGPCPYASRCDGPFEDCELPSLHDLKLIVEAAARIGEAIKKVEKRNEVKNETHV